MATFTQPGVNLNIPTPDEGEVFLGDGILSIRQGNEVKQLSGVYGYGGETSGVDNATTLQQLGLDPAKVRSFNVGDLELGGLTKSLLGTYFKDGVHAQSYGSDAERQAALQSNIGLFTSLYSQVGKGFGTGSSTTTGVYDPAAAQAALNPNSPEQTAARNQVLQQAGFTSPEQAIAANQQSSTVQAAAGAQEPASTTSNPFFGIPAGAAQTTEEAQTLQSGGTLGSGGQPNQKADDNMVNSLYNKYFSRNATPAELANWGSQGGKDTTVEALDNFLQQEQVKYGVDGGGMPEAMGGTGTTNPDGTPSEVGNNKMTTFQKTYTGLLNTIGVSDIKSKFEEINDKYTELQNELNDKITDINDNPWLTEGVRVKQIESLKKRYEGREGNLTNQMKLYNSLYQEGLAQAQFLATGIQKDQQFMMQLAQDKDDAAAKLKELGYDFVDANGRKYLVSYDNKGNVVKKVDIGASTKTSGIAGLTTQQATLFNSIVSQQNRSPLIQAADRTPVLSSSIQAIKQNPSSGTLQLNLAYSYIQALDTYQSAVREGELGLVNSIDSKIGGLQNSVQQIQNGQIVRPEVALQIASAAENIVNTINTAARAKAQSFQSQAEVLGLGDAWAEYTGGFTSTFDQGSGDNTQNNTSVYQIGLGAGIAKSEIDKSLQENGYDATFQYIQGLPQVQSVDPNLLSRVGGDTNAASIAAAIKQVESGGNYQARGGSGEFGAYQFMPATWSGWAKQYLGNANAPQTKENQDKVALAKIQDLLDQGYDAREIALIWNGGTPVVKKGTNKYGVAYDSGAYANKVLSVLG